MRHAEMVILAHLSIADSLDEMAREGLLTAVGREIIPSEAVQKLTTWALDTFFASGRTVAPSPEAIQSTWGDLLEQLEIVIDADTETDTVTWAIADLRANYARLQAEALINAFATDMASADGPDRVDVFTRYADQMFLTAQALVSRRNEMDGYHGIADAILRLEQRIESGHVTRGITLGIEAIDAHTFGTHPGEITTIGGPPASGKSWLAGFIALANWREGRKIVLVTLENDVPMSYDRLCCMAVGVDYNAWQRGEILTPQKTAVFALLDKMESSECRPIFAQLDLSQRTASGIMRKAMLEGADGVIIDQLSFLSSESEGKHTRRTEAIGQIMHRIKYLANETAVKIPVVLLTQLKREGIAAARKSGRNQVEDLAESASIEQTSDTVWVILQTEDMKFTHEARLQQLKSRRTPVKDFDLLWRPEIGLIQVSPT